MTVRIVTDSTADIPHADAEALGVSVVPLKVIFGSEEYRDGVDLENATFYRKLQESRDLPRTSQPSPADFQQTYQQLIDEGADAILSVHLSAKLSGTYQSACTARDTLPEEIQKKIAIEIVDSESVSMAMGMAVLQAAQEAKEGKSLEEIRERLQERLRRTRILAALDTLEFLRRGGRIGGAAAFLGTMLSFKPIVSLREGAVVPVERPRTRGKAYERIAQMLADAGQVEQVLIVEAGEDVGQQLAAALKGVYQGEIPRYKLGAVLGTHTGPGTAGIIFRTAAR